MRNKITDEEIKNDIIKVKNLVNKIPTQEDYKKLGSFSINTILLRGPWNKWLVELFNTTNVVLPQENINKITNKELIDNLQELVGKLGRAPKQDELKLGKYSIMAYKRAFGSFSNALKQIDLLPVFQFNLPEQVILNDIRRVFNELGHIPSCLEFDKLNKTVSVQSINTRFGSWTNALKLAGVPIVTQHKLTKEEIIDALHKWYKENSEDVRCLEYWKIRKAKSLKKFPYSAETISNRFEHKSWAEIMKSIGFTEYETVDQYIKKGFFQGFDGITYLSSIEKQVGDILYNLKRENKIVNYAYEQKVCDTRDWTCDFVVATKNGNFWIEIDGLVGNRKDPYGSGFNEKIEYYKRNGLNFYVVTYRNKDVFARIKEILFV